MEREQTQSDATGTAHKLKVDESASGAACMERNVINDHSEFDSGLKRTIGARGKPFSSKGHTTMHHTRKSSVVICVISSADREF
jgi:hypothetical protein